MRWPMAVAWWLILSSLGVLMIALPDSGPRLIHLSDAHGPGLLDTIGVVALLAGAAGPWWFIWRRRGRLVDMTAGTQVTCAFVAGLGVGLLVASVLSDFGAWWAIGAGLLAALQVVIFVGVARPGRPALTPDFL